MTKKEDEAQAAKQAAQAKQETLHGKRVQPAHPAHVETARDRAEASGEAVMHDKGYSSDLKDARTKDPDLEEKVDVQGATYFQARAGNEVEGKPGQVYRWPEATPPEGQVVLAARGGVPYVARFHRQQKDGPKGQFYSRPNKGSDFSVAEGSADTWMVIPDMNPPADKARTR